MTLFDVLLLLLVAGVCGALGQAISGYSRGGCLVSIALGFIGALVGLWLSRQLRLPEIFAVQIGTTRFPVIWAIIGSALFVAVISLISRRRA
ncbi:MAG: GlsB/YeaQ/YmgE family stress response membrane protein [Pyrinomonadaceae bacterium]